MFQSQYETVWKTVYSQGRANSADDPTTKGIAKKINHVSLQQALQTCISLFVWCFTLHLWIFHSSHCGQHYGRMKLGKSCQGTPRATYASCWYTFHKQPRRKPALSQHELAATHGVRDSRVIVLRQRPEPQSQRLIQRVCRNSSYGGSTAIKQWLFKPTHPINKQQDCNHIAKSVQTHPYP